MSLKGILSHYLLLASSLALVTSGCTTTSSTDASALKISAGERVDLSRYTVATVVPFELSEKARKKDAQFGENFAANIAGRLKSDFGSIFQEVRWNQPLRQPHELIISGVIDSYEPGDPGLRFLLIGLGAANFNGKLVLKDGADQRELMSAPFSKLWAWGGLLGSIKTIDHMVSETAAAAAKTVAAQKQGGNK